MYMNTVQASVFFNKVSPIELKTTMSNHHLWSIIYLQAIFNMY